MLVTKDLAQHALDILNTQAPFMSPYAFETIKTYIMATMEDLPVYHTDPANYKDREHVKHS